MFVKTGKDPGAYKRHFVSCIADRQFVPACRQKNIAVFPVMSNGIAKKISDEDLDQYRIGVDGEIRIELFMNSDIFFLGKDIQMVDHFFTSFSDIDLFYLSILIVLDL